MWSRVVTVVIVSCLVSSVVSVAADLEDNVVPEDSLQDLTVRTKKSPSAEDSEKTPSDSQSKSDSQLKAVLTEDIKRKIEDLKELKNAYRKVEADFFGSESQTLKSSVDSEILVSETETPLENIPEDESVRIARQYYPPSYSGSQYQNQKYDNEKGRYPDNSYLNGKYQSISPHPLDSYADREAPYIAQYNPSSRTFGAFKIDTHKVHDIKPEVSIQIPAIPINQEEVLPEVIPASPVYTELPHPPSPVNTVLPASLPTITVSEHKPYKGAGHTKKLETNVPLYYEKKEIGTPGSFFSKQVIYGPSKNYGEGNSYYPYTPYSSYQQGDGHSQQGYSTYSQGYPYGGYPSNWYATDKGGYSSLGYTSYPDAQANYNYWPVYSSGSPYQAYNPAGAYRSNRDLSDQFQRYQDELDSLLSQFFRVDMATNSTTSGIYSTVGQLKEAIEREEKKIETLREELNTSKGSNDGSGVSESFVKWLSGEIDGVYSSWTHLKDDITKSKPDPRGSEKQDLKVENVKV